MKTLHLHALWAVIAVTGTTVGIVASRRASPEGVAPDEARSSAALRARISALEAELSKRRGTSGGEIPAEAGSRVLPTAGATEVKEDARPADRVVPSLTPEQIVALLKGGNRDDVAKAVKEIDLITDPHQKLALLRMMVESGDRALAARALPMLKKLGGPEAVELIIAVLSREGSSGTRAQAAVTLGELGDASALPALQEAWRTGDVQLRTGVAVGLDRFGQREPAQVMLHTLGGMLQSADGGAREDAVDLLMKFSLPGSLPLLVTALGDPTNNHVREDAADAMGAQKLAEAIPFLEKALQDPSPNVRQAAQRAITRIKETKP